MKDDLRNARYVIDIGPVPSLPVVGSELRFPVGRIYCVGRNYADHAREMGHDPDREPPFFFMKPANAIVQDGSTIAYPVATKDVHHEIEMVVAIGKGGAEHPGGQGARARLGLRRRARHDPARRPGRGQEDGPAVGDGQGIRRVRALLRAAPASAIGHPAKGAIWLKVNGEVKQKGDLARADLERAGADRATCRTWSRCSRAT